MNHYVKRILFMGIGCLVGGFVEGGLCCADEKLEKKKLGLPSDATEEELRDARRAANETVPVSDEAQKILDSLED